MARKIILSGLRRDCIGEKIACNGEKRACKGTHACLYSGFEIVPNSRSQTADVTPKLTS